jgi:hypothetical protein
MSKSRDAGRTKFPGWFSLGKYERIAGLDAAGWYGQITVRQICASQLRDIGDPNPIFPERDDTIRQALTSLREDPICDLTCSPFDDGAFSYCRNLKFPEVPVVRSMTFWDFCGIDSRIRKTLPQYQVDEADRLAGYLSSEPIAVLYPPPEWLKADLRSECFFGKVIPVMIDPQFPNSVLRQHFEMHLRRLRRQEKKIPEVNRHSPDLCEWCRLGVLPCMDLLLWEDERKVSLTNRAIADALGTDEGKVRKTTRPLARVLLQMRGADVDGFVHLSRLRSRAYQDSVQRQEIRTRISRSKKHK